MLKKRYLAFLVSIPLALGTATAVSAADSWKEAIDAYSNELISALFPAVEKEIEETKKAAVESVSAYSASLLSGIKTELTAHKETAAERGKKAIKDYADTKKKEMANEQNEQITKHKAQLDAQIDASVKDAFDEIDKVTNTQP